MEKQAYRFTWRGIEIEAIYTPLQWKTIAHLEVRSIKPERAPLPITETGYRSHFHQPAPSKGWAVMWWSRSSHGWTRRRTLPNGAGLWKLRGSLVCSKPPRGRAVPSGQFPKPPNKAAAFERRDVFRPVGDQDAIGIVAVR